MFRLLLFTALTVALVTSCRRSPDNSTTQPEKASTNQRTFQVKGVVIELKPKQNTVKIRHEEIPGYMQAMTMEFDVKNTNELGGLEPGNSVSFRMIVSDKEGWIDQIRKLSSVPTNSLPTTPLRIMRDVEPLKVGDPLPEYHFTNQFGQTISTAQF